MSSHSSTKTILSTLASLLLLLGAALCIHFLPGIPAKTPLTIIIAGVKILLVMWFFMRANKASGITPFYIAAGFVWLVLLFLLTSMDYLTRL